MLFRAFRLSVFGYAACCAVSYGAVRYRGVDQPIDIANTMATVSFLLAVVAFPLLGGSRFARGATLDEDPRRSSDGPDQLDNRARGIALMVAALAWLGTAIGWYSGFAQ